MDYEKKITRKEKSSAELSITIKESEVQKKYESLINKYSKELQIPGFRKGKVPIKILETKYGDAIRSDLAGDLIEDSLKDVFESLDEYERPLPYSYPELKEKPELKLGENFSFTVGYDVFPKVEVKPIENFSIKIPEVEISDKDIQKELENLQDRNALVADCKEDAIAEKNNIATIDYCELDDSSSPIKGTEREDFVFTIGSGENLFKIDDDIIGMKKGESKDITKTYPEDEENSDLAGKTKKIRLSLKALKYKDLPPIDDDLAQDINEKYKNLDDLKKDIKKNFQNNVDNKTKQLKEKKLTDHLIEKNSFDLPESMLKAELESRWLMMANQFRTSPEKLEQILNSSGKTKEELLDEWKPDAEKSLKGRVLIEILMKEKDIEVKDDEIENEYKRLAELINLTVEEVKKHYEDPRQKDSLIDEIKEDKLFNILYENCKIEKDKKLSLEDFFKNNN